MEFAQLNANGSYSHQITTHGNVEWDATHFCPASALTPAEAAYFRVVPLMETPMPAVDPLTHLAIRDGGEKVNGQWQYKWRVDALTAEQVAANMEAKAAAELAAKKYERAVAVENIKVTTQAGHEFDGDEDSQTRMARAIIALQATGAPNVKWVLANNVPTLVPVAELVEALALAGAAQASIWSSPYE